MNRGQEELRTRGCMKVLRVGDGRIGGGGLHNSGNE